jgi:hypothetical protein
MQNVEDKACDEQFTGDRPIDSAEDDRVHGTHFQQ